jgi:uncharacterized protein with PIN domain
MSDSPVLCPGCGREYDSARFAFGSTLHCTCGARVGAESPAPALEPGAEPRFLADAMLGRLARWLRLLGFDTAYDAALGDAELARRALEEGRIVLTRDRALPEEWRLPRVIVLRAESLREQLRELARALPLRGGRAFSRCTHCNAPLEDVAREDVAALLPPRVRARQSDFRRCSACGRVYWEGSHVSRIRRALDEVFAG